MMQENLRTLESYRRYLEYAGKSPGTAKVYTTIVRMFLDFIGKPISDIEKMDIVDFYDFLREERGYADRTLALAGWALKSFLEFIGKIELSMWVPIPRYSVSAEPKWLSETVVMEIVRDSPPLAVAYDLALRLREVTLLRRDRWNPATGDIEVVRLKHKGRPNKYMLRMSGWVNELVKHYVSENNPPPDRLFPISPRTLQKMFKERLRAVGIDPSEYSFHTLRHSRATHIAIHEPVSYTHLTLPTH